MNTKKLLFVALMMMCAITVHALQLREGHFFKTFSDVQPMVKAAPALFDQWFALPEDTEWREVSRQTDNIGMERIEYRQYVGGVEVEYSQVLLHVRDGRVQSANGTVMEQQRTPAKLQRNSVMSRGVDPAGLRPPLILDGRHPVQHLMGIVLLLCDAATEQKYYTYQYNLLHLFEFCAKVQTSVHICKTIV
jgi:hypothetical protein